MANHVLTIWSFISVLFAVGATNAALAGIFYECRLEGKAPSYLLGTMHASEPRVLAIADDVEPYLKKIERLVLEIVPDGQTMLAVTLATQLPPHESLEDLLPAELYRATQAAMSERGIPEIMFKRMRPWAVMVELSLPQSQRGVFLDLRIFQIAQELGKELVGLETVDEQMGLFDGLTISQQTVLLEHALKNLEALSQQFKEIVDAYVSGDLEALAQAADEQQRELDDELAAWFDREVVEKRNLIMAKRAWPLIETGNTLVAVGALHLAGETGLVAFLRERGCNLSRLR